MSAASSGDRARRRRGRAARRVQMPAPMSIRLPFTGRERALVVGDVRALAGCRGWHPIDGSARESRA
ncbi:MAG TPA: hypothetical protein VM734_06030 [Kofleriaceae bacterium]|nr:hypothetical protein [Kofleriaceae bacterium]